MTIGFGQSIKESAYETGYDEFSVGLGASLKASAQEAWKFNPMQSVDIYFEMEQARMQEKEFGYNDILKQQEAGPVPMSVLTSQSIGSVPVSKEKLNEQYKNIGLFFEEDEYQSVVDIMAREKELELKRQSILQRGPQGILPGAAKLGVGLLTSVVDPVNLAVSFIPVFGQTRYASLVAKQGFGRARFTKGVVEGAVGAAIIEPLIYSVAQKVQADYDIMDSFLNIGFGSIIGGGLHVAAGKLKDMKTASDFKRRVKKAKKEGKLLGNDEPELNLYREYYPENSRIMRDLEQADPSTHTVLINKALGDMMSETPVDVTPVANADIKLKDSSGSAASPTARVNADKTANQSDLDTAEFNVEKEDVANMDSDIDNLSIQLDKKRIAQADVKFKVDDAIDMSTKALDDFNTKNEDVDSIIKDAINCINGR